MQEQLLPLLIRLRERAENYKNISNYALAGVLITLIIGTLIFIYASSKIAAEDIEQQQKINSSENAISRLANLKLEIQKNDAKLQRAKNWDFDELRFFSKFSSSRPSKVYYDKNLRERTFNFSSNLIKLDDFISELKMINNYFMDEKSKIDFLDLEKEEQEKRMENLRSLTEKLSDSEYKYSQIITKPEHESEDEKEYKRFLLMTTDVEIQNYKKQIYRLKKEIEEFDNKLNSGAIFEEIVEKVDNSLKINNILFNELEKYRIELDNYLIEYNEHLKKVEYFIEDLQVKGTQLEAQKDLLLNISSETQLSDNKTAFYVSTNIARLGIIVLTIFFAQIFISIYRYSTKISNFYHSRADAFELLSQTGIFKNHDLANLIEMFSNILAPDKVDFSSIPQSSSEDLLKNLHLYIKKD